MTTSRGINTNDHVAVAITAVFNRNFYDGYYTKLAAVKNLVKLKLPNIKIQTFKIG